MLSALGADCPEISSAVIALLSGARDVGVGVVLGACLFDLAVLLGLSALVAGSVRIRREALLLDSIAGIGVLLFAGSLIGGLLRPPPAALGMLAMFAGYAGVLAVGPRHLRRFRFVWRGVPRDLQEIAYEATHDRPAARHDSWLPVLLVPLALAGVVGGSFVMVRMALTEAPGMHLSDAVLGTLVLAALTSLPNLWVALHFARNDRGTALFSAAMNSNTINLVGGVGLPALALGLAEARSAAGDITWLIALTGLAVLVPALRGGLSRAFGGLLLAVYLVFVLQRIVVA